MGILDSLKTYSVNELEQRAQEVLRQYPQRSIPIDIEWLVESMAGVVLDIYPGLRLNHNLWGMTGIDPETATIIIYVDDELADREDKFRLYRMTVAEEMAHVLIHRKAIEQVKSPRDFIEIQASEKWHECERNAKRLAAALLMPARQVQEDAQRFYREMVAVVGFDHPDAVKKLLVSKMAEKYVVSVQTMQFRLNEWPIKALDKINTAMKNRWDIWE